MKSLRQIAARALLGALLLAAPAAFAQTSPATGTKDTNSAAQKAAPHSAKEKSAKGKAKAGPFHGKLANLDKSAQTIMVGKRTFHITSETEIMSGGKSATLSDAVVGETVSGYVKPMEDGRLVATKLTLGKKVETAKSKSKPGSEKKS